jgi:hypothetical protein
LLGYDDGSHNRISVVDDVIIMIAATIVIMVHDLRLRLLIVFSPASGLSPTRGSPIVRPPPTTTAAAATFCSQ